MATQSAEVETGYSAAHSDARSARSRKTAIIAAILLVILVVGIFAASRYQPLEISGLIGIDHPAGTGETSTSQEFGLKNTGPVGITIVAIKGGRISVSDEVSRVAPALRCPYTVKNSYNCGQNEGTGLLTGVKFRPFGLATDDVRPILWLYQFPCGSSATSGVQEGVLAVPVTYRFMWFTHTIRFTEDTNVSGTCS